MPALLLPELLTIPSRVIQEYQCIQEKNSAYYQANDDEIIELQYFIFFVVSFCNLFFSSDWLEAIIQLLQR